MTAHWGDAPEPLTEARMMQYIRSKPAEDRAGIVGKRNVLGPAQWKRGLAKSGIEFDKKGRFVGSPRRVPEELIQPKEDKIIPEIEKDLQGNAENGIFSRGDDMVDNAYSSGTGAVQPGRQPTDIERLRAMEPEVKEKDVEKILEKAMQNDGESVIFKNNDALVAIGTPIQANPERAAETLQQFEMAIKDCKTHEIGVVVRPDGELLCVVRGSSGRVIIFPEWENGSIVTHNHPLGSYAPSVKDVNKFVGGGSVSIRTVTLDRFGDGRFSSLEKVSGSTDTVLGEKMSNRFYSTASLMSEVTDLVVDKYGANWTSAQIMHEKNRLLIDWLSANALYPNYIFSEGVLR
jgi:hypothetical protein